MSRKLQDTDDWFYCPNCGGQVKVGAKACRECGSDDNTGWKEDTADGLDLPDDDFDYEEFTRREFGGDAPGKVNGLRWYWWLTALVLLTLFLAGLLGHFGLLSRTL